MHNEIAAIVDDIKLNGDEDTDIYVSAIMEIVDKDSELTVSYTPGAIRDSVDSYEDDNPIKLAVKNATDEELRDIAYMIVGSDPVWSRFHEDIDMCVREKFKIEEN